MQTHPLGPFDVARIGFGAMQLPGPGVFGPPRDRDQALAVLDRAVALGVNHIDTSQYYGPDVANELIREALHPYPADLALVSKVGARRDAQGGWLPFDRPDELRQGIEDNLRALDIDRLAAVNLRIMPPREAPDEIAPLDPELFGAQLDAMITARDEGLISGIGLSNIGADHLSFALERTEIACVQNAFNLLDRSAAPVLELCAGHGIAFVPFFPLGGFSPIQSDGLTKIAARLQATPLQLALAWLLYRAPNILLIPGTSSVAHLRENVAAADLVLTGEVLTELDALARPA